MSAEPGKPPSPSGDKPSASVPVGLVVARRARSRCSRSTTGPARGRRRPPSRVRVPYSPFFLSRSRRATWRRSRRRAPRSRARSRRRRATRARSRRRASRPRSRRSRTPTRSRAARAEGRGGERASRWTGRALVGEPARRLRADDPLHRPAGLADAPRRGVQSVLGSFGRSRARRYEPSGDRVTFADVAGIDEAKDELSRSSTSCAIPRSTAARRPDPARRAAWARPGPARRCWRGRSRARRTCRSSRCRPRSSSRRSSASARRACATCSRRRRRPRPRSSSSTSWTRSAARAPPARRVQRRQRRARADAEPDPHRDGRLRLRPRA